MTNSIYAETIYAVSAGAYSDYSVLAVFESRADAEAHVTEYNARNAPYEPATVEEFAFYRHGSKPRLVEQVTIYGEEVRKRPIWDYNACEFTSPFSDSAIAATEERARKILQDERARRRAEQEGLT